MSAPQRSSAGSAAQAALFDLSSAVQLASSPRVRPTLTHLAQLCGGRCWCVSRTVDGRLLMGRDDDLEIIATSGELLSCTRAEGFVTGACELMGRFYWLIDTGPLFRTISVRDGRSLKEISSWTLPDCCWTNLAVLGRMLVVPDPCQGRLLVYSSDGQLLSQHAVSGEPRHVSTSGTDVIVSDGTNHTVSVYDMSSSTYRLKFRYAGLKNPTAAAVGSNEHIYVGSFGSEGTNKVHVLSATGQLVTELQHNGLSDCWGLNITGDELMAATNKGLHLYQLGR